MMPTPPTSTPFLYSGNPPGSAASPSGERFGPMKAPPAPPTRVLRSEHGSCENCTPNSGPDSSPTVVRDGGKCCWTICDAVRVEKALPPDERYAPVTALAMAPSAAGKLTPWTSVLLPTPARVVAVARAPAMVNTASTLPTRSVTAITAGNPRACASAAARAMMPSISAAVSASAAGLATTLAGVAGVEGMPAVPPPLLPLAPPLPVAPPPPPHAATSIAPPASQPMPRWRARVIAAPGSCPPRRPARRGIRWVASGWRRAPQHRRDRDRGGSPARRRDRPDAR